VEKLEPLVRAFAALEKVRLWYSAGSDTGYPPNVPPAVQVACLQDTASVPEQTDLLFQTRGIRKLGLPLAIPVCVHRKDGAVHRSANRSRLIAGT
jgi:hypothetical protein